MADGLRSGGWQAQHSARSRPVLATLSAEERAALLGRLLDSRPDLVEVVEQLAAEALERVDADEVAGDVTFALRPPCRRGA